MRISYLRYSSRQRLKRGIPRVLFDAAGGSSITINASVDALVIAEQQATVGLSIPITATVDALVIAEQVATVGLSIPIAASADALVIAEQAANIALNVTIFAGVDALVITEQQATISLATNIQASADALVIAEQQATITLDAVATSSVIGSGNLRSRRRSRRIYSHGYLAGQSDADLDQVARQRARSARQQYGPISEQALNVIAEIASQQTADGDPVSQLGELLNAFDRVGIGWEDHYGGHLKALRDEYRALEEARKRAAVRLAKADEAQRERIVARSQEYIRAARAAVARKRAAALLVMATAI